MSLFDTVKSKDELIAKLNDLAIEAASREDEIEAESARRGFDGKRSGTGGGQKRDGKSSTKQQLLAALESAATKDGIAAAACRFAYYIRNSRVCPQDQIATLEQLMTWEAPDVRGESTDSEAEIGRVKREGLRDLAAIFKPRECSVRWFPLWGPMAFIRYHDERTLVEGLPAAEVHRRWVALKKRPRHFLLAIANAWQEAKGYPPEHVEALTVRLDDCFYMRTPGLMSLAALTPMEAVAVDGEPFGSVVPVRILHRVPVPPLTSPDPLPGPRTLDSVVADPVLSVLSGIDSDDWMDGRSPIRSDVLTLVRLGCAILKPVTMDVKGWARLLRGQHGIVQHSARIRAEKALRAGAILVCLNDKRYQMIRSLTEGSAVTIQPSSFGGGWWKGGRGAADAWRLSGGLWRAHWTRAKEGGCRRMAEGIEAALAWTPPDRRRESRVPKGLRPVGDKKGKPGQEYFLGWQRVIYLSGEPWPGSADGNARRTYQRRVAAFKKADYLVPVKRSSAPAPAGDTWEILRIERGGIVVRATARYVGAVQLSQQPKNFTRITLDHLLRSSPSDI